MANTGKSSFFKRLRTAALVASASLGVALALLWKQQDAMIFPGSHLAMPVPHPSTNAFLLPLTASDGTALQAWWVPTTVPLVSAPARSTTTPFKPPQTTQTQSSNALPIVVYLGGNYEQVSWFIQEVSPLLATQGIASASMNYRGFAGNPGKPSQDSLVSDALHLINTLKQQHSNARIILIGRSLGSGVASQVYAKLQERNAPPPSSVACLTLITPFAKLADPAQERFSFVPAPLIRALLRHPFDSQSALSTADSSVPIYIVQAGKDHVIPAWSTQNLITSLPSHVRTVQYLPDASHANVMTGPVFWNALGQFMSNKCIDSKPPTTTSAITNLYSIQPPNPLSSPHFSIHFSVKHPLISITPTVQSALKPYFPLHPILLNNDTFFSSWSALALPPDVLARHVREPISAPSSRLWTTISSAYTSVWTPQERIHVQPGLWYFSTPTDTRRLDAHFMDHITFLKHNSWLPTFILPKH